MTALIGPDGCRIGRPETLILHQALILAATLPNDDFDAFQFATAILLADRLQNGWGQDDLFWHWDAFHQHYALADAPVRAALMRGYERMQADGLVSLEDPPGGLALLTEARAAVEDALQDAEHESAGVLLGALEEATPDPDFWHLHCSPNLRPAAHTPKAILRGIRHLFESHAAWEPFGEDYFDPAEGGAAPVIPFWTV